MTNPYPEGSGEHLLYAIFGELPGPNACECGMPTQCPPSPTAVGGHFMDGHWGACDPNHCDHPDHNLT